MEKEKGKRNKCIPKKLPRRRPTHVRGLQLTNREKNRGSQGADDCGNIGAKATGRKHN